MYADMLSAFGGSLRNVFGPVRKINELAVTHMEKVVAIQLESAKSYANLGIAHLKAATEVDDPQSFFGYTAKQGAFVTKVGEQFVADVQKLGELGGDFIEKARSVAKEEARAIGGAFGEAAKVPAKKAA